MRADLTAPDTGLYWAESSHHCIRRLVSGSVETVAGVCGVSGYSDGAALLGLMNTPLAIAFSGGDLFIADSGGCFGRSCLTVGPLC